MHLAHHRFAALKQRHEPAHVSTHHCVINHWIPIALGVVVVSDYSGVEWRSGRRRCRGLVSPAQPSLALGALHEVIATTETLAVARQEEHVNTRVEVGELDALFELANHGARYPVAALRPVERDPRDAVGDLVGERL